MTNDEYSAILAQFESEKNANPAAFHGKVRRFIALGFMFFAVITLFFTGLLGLAILLIVAGSINRLTIYLVIAGAIGFYTVLKMVFLRHPAPEGETLSPQAAPKLFSRLDELGKKIGAPPIKAVRLIDELNAYAAAVPKFFLFGKPDLHVAVGVPLMAYMKTDELDSVLAHELAHHTNRDTDISLKVHRVMETWRILAQSKGTWIDWSPFFARWYYPRIAAMSDVLSRDMEFAADRLAGLAVGNDVTARSLMRLTFPARNRRKKQSEVLVESVDESETPFPDRTARMVAIAHQPTEVTMTSLEAEARRVSLTGDSHPSLAERLASLGYPLTVDSEQIQQWHREMQEPLTENALDEYLGGSNSPIAKKLDAEWSKEFESTWKSYREQRAYSRAIVEEYESRSIPLVPQERAEYSYHLGIIGKKEKAVEYLEKSNREFPNDLPVLRAFALAAISIDDPRTEELLDRLYEVPAFRFETDEIRYGWYQRNGRTNDAEQLAKQLRSASQEWDRTVETVMPWDNFSVVSATPITETERNKLRLILDEHKQVESAYYAKLERPDVPGLYRRVLLVIINLGKFYKDADDQFIALTRNLFPELELWTTADVRILPSKNGDAKKAIAKMEPYKIFHRSD
ncbi:MAG: M48 family metallopeptidase [Fimbriimonadaceae bacterium]|nr:MAG: M48 family metallopeptidase [Fimbriimonadaceae bacterium]